MKTLFKWSKMAIMKFALIILTLSFGSINSVAGYFQMTENQKIEYLIQSVENLEGGKFYRNGEWHTPKEAAAHLRMKWKNAGNRIKTVKQFIDKIATSSSLTGQPYKVKYKDGKVLESRVFFYLQLNKLK
jgi:hypothetical protein